MYSYTSSCSPCAACKMLRRKCTEDCPFAPYFRADQPQKFASVHKVFGASNVSKLLNELPVEQREDAVKSLVYEADARLRDPVHGCVGLISMLQHKLKHLQMDLYNAKKELATYIGPSAMLPIIQGTENFLPRYQHEQAQALAQAQAQAQMMSYSMQQGQMMPSYNLQRPQKLAPYSMQRGPMRPHNMQQAQMRSHNMQQAQMIPHNMQQARMMGGLQQTVANPSPLSIQQQQYQQFMEAQQVAAAVAAVKEQEMLRSCEAQKAFAAKEQELLRNNDLEELEILREQEYYKNHMAQHIAAREQQVILRTYREKQQAALAQQQGSQSDLLVGYDITGQGQVTAPKEQELLRNNELEEVEMYREKQHVALAQQQGPQSDLLVGYDIKGQGRVTAPKEQELLRNNELEELEIPRGQECYKNYMAQHIAARENELIPGGQEYYKNYMAQHIAARENELIPRGQEYYKNYMAQHIAARENELISRTYPEKQQAALLQQQGPQSDLLVEYDITGQDQDQGNGQIPSGESSQMSVQAGTTPALAFGSLENPYQIQQHTEDDPPHLHHHHHQLQATQLSLEEQEELQALALVLEQPLHLDPHEALALGLALEQPLQLDPQQEQQHQDGSEEEVGSFDPGSIGPL